MVSKQVMEDIKGGSKIRAMFVEGKELAKSIGKENVFDFSLGNPMTPVPKAYDQAMIDLIREEDSNSLHGYMDNMGFLEVRQAVAENLNKRFHTGFSGRNIIMTAGAAGAMNIILKTLLDPGDEVMVFVPYFPEYRSYCRNWQGSLVEVKPDYHTFLPDLEDLTAKITPRTKALIINNPVNPTGVVYPEEMIVKITDLLKKKQREYGHAIYLISDEPYRELVYDGEKVAFLTNYYKNTFITYSFSKSLSIPGDRIGYVAVADEMEDFELVMSGLAISNRITGFVNAPALMQKAVARCLDEQTDVSYYDRNRGLIYAALTKMGFQCVKPKGAFYLFIKSPVEDEEEFVRAAKEYHIFLVGGASFSCPGYVRLAYCVSYEMIEKALPSFQRLKEERYDTMGK